MPRPSAVEDSFRALSHRARRLLIAAAVVVVAAAGVGIGLLIRSQRDKTAAPPPPAVGAPARAGGSFLRLIVPTRAGGLPGADVPRRIARRVARMPVERKVAQTMLVGFGGTDATSPLFARLRARPLGGVVIRRANYVNAEQLRLLAGEVRVVAAQSSNEPPFVLAPQEGGEFRAFGDLPPATAAADLASPAEAGQESAQAADALAAAGLNGVLGPVIDVGVEDGGAVGARAFSDEPARVAAYGKAVVGAYRSRRMLTAPEHFPGIGSASQAPEEGPGQVGLTVEQLRRSDLVPFRAAVRAGAPAVVIGNAAFATDDFVVPGSLSRAVATELLRGQLGFRGVAISGDLSEPAITAGTPVTRAAVQALRAGCDMVHLTGSAAVQEQVYQALVRAVRKGAIPRARLDEAVTRILTVKRELGLVRGQAPRVQPGVPAQPTTPPASPAAP
jgi:beta-N-acetylhexosaminidase